MFRIFRHYLSRHIFFLTLADLIILVVAGSAGWLTPLLGLPPLWLGFDPVFPKVLLFVGLGWFVLFVGGAYGLSPQQGRKEIVIRLMACFCALTFLLSAIGFVFPTLRWGRLALLAALILGFCVVSTVRLATLRLWDTPHFRERLLLLGDTPLADRLIETLSKVGARGYEVLGYVDNREGADQGLHNGYPPDGMLRRIDPSVGGDRICLPNPALGPSSAPRGPHPRILCGQHRSAGNVAVMGHAPFPRAALAAR